MENSEFQQPTVVPTPTLPTLPTLPPRYQAGTPIASAAWAPPAPGAVVSTAQPAPALIPVVDQPKRSRRGMWVGIAAASALVVGGGGGALLAMRGGDSPSVEAYSIEAAADGASDVNTATIDMTIQFGEMNMDAVMTVDLDAGLMQASMEMGELLGEAGVDSPMELIFDLNSQTMYMSTAAFGDLAPTDADWVSVDASADMGENPFEEMQGANPFDVAPLFNQEGVTIEEIGFDEVNGEKVKHYRATMELAAVAEADALGEQFEELEELGFAETLEFDVYVTDDNQVRRMTFELEVLGETISYDMTVIAIGDEVEPIVLPDPQDVVTEEELMGG
jgi:hypothetical protein